MKQQAPTTTNAKQRRLRTAAFVLVLASLGGAQAVAQSAGSVPQVDVGPPLSASIDDAIWRQAAVFTTFQQATPKTGAPPTQRTELRLLHDGRTLYGVVRAFDTAPNNVVARTLKRDAESIDGDDHITLVLDPRGTAANGFWFRFNALGARRDGLVFDGNQARPEWDADWQVVARRDDAGWSATFAIPLSIMAAPADGRAWRFNVERLIAATGERVRLFNAVADREVTALADAAPLDGIRPTQQGWGLRMRPGLRWSSEQQGGSPRRMGLKPSLDVLYALTPGVSLSATFNTDFAEADADARQVNLSRFELFRPEKRTFFTQDAGRFAFGGLDSDEPNLLPFFSRRVGLGSSLDAGLKVSGSAGPVEFGALAVQVRRTDEQRVGDQGTPRVAVVRAAGAVADGHRVGAIATSGNPEGVRGSSLVGLDYQTNGDVPWGDGTWQAFAWWMQSRNLGTGQGQGKGFALRAFNDGPWLEHSYQSLDEGFKPALGFVRENGVQRTEHAVGWRERFTSGATVIGRMFAGGRRRMDGRERSHYIGPNAEYESRGDVIGTGYFFEREVVALAFNVVPRILVPAGDSRTRLGEFYVRSSETRAWSGELSLRAGGYFGDGRLQTQVLRVHWRPSPHWAVSGQANRQALWLRGERFVAKTAQAQLEFIANTESRQALVLQRDNVSGATSVGLRSLWSLGEGRQVLGSLDRVRGQGSTMASNTLASVKLIWPWAR
jgi:Domain of unknown function (DUF5916)